MASPTQNVKRTAEVRTYSFDFSKFPEIVAGDTLTGTPTITVAGTGLTLGSPSISSNLVKVQISAGTNGTVYVMKCQCSTVGGSTLVCGGMLLVSDP